ncbi:putative DNA helicase [Xanthomonas phage FoX4]|uniref:Putative DNA helicase n=1 Tax=Xanthomonas phage FoX4 TaxID=2723900 RepID=A0A858WLW9_9CAUD|nr:DNA helicase [Xanthomonas phage FoX4]QJI52967.1 putative DNA helicase [Xanthomonas phage FoX4]
MSYLSEIIDAKMAECIRCREDMHNYQRMAEKFLMDNPFSALFIDLGLGKTIISLTVILNLIVSMRIENALVIAPLRVANNTWPDEIPQWTHTTALSYEHLRNEELIEAVNAAGRAEKKLCVQEGLNTTATKARVEKARLKVARAGVRARYAKSRASVHIINREQVEFLVEAWGKDWPYKCVFIDESSSFKDHTSNRFKALRRVRPLMTRMHQLTATPTAESYLHLFAQIFLLDQGKRFGRNYGKFFDRYATQNKYTRKKTMRPGAEEEIMAAISDICLTLKAEDYLEMPPLHSLVRKIHLPPRARALYDTMEQEMVIELSDDVEIESETAAALSQKLLQMASGVVYETRMTEVGPDEFVPKRIVHHLHDEKIEELRQICEENEGRPILVAYHHKASLDRLLEAFKGTAVAMGREGAEVKAWNQGKIKMLLVHPQSAGHGLNLQHGGDLICFFDIPWSLELYLQLIGRLHRQGQKSAVRVYHLVADRTIDEAVMAAIGVKRALQDALFAYLKKVQARARRVAMKQLGKHSRGEADLEL